MDSDVFKIAKNEFKAMRVRWFSIYRDATVIITPPSFKQCSYYVIVPSTSAAVATSRFLKLMVIDWYAFRASGRPWIHRRRDCGMSVGCAHISFIRWHRTPSIHSSNAPG